MSDLDETTVTAPQEPPAETAAEPQPEMPQDPVTAMNGFIAVKVICEGRSTSLWQDIRAGEVIGFVDRLGRPVSLEGVFETRVIDGNLLDSPGTKGTTP